MKNQIGSKHHKTHENGGNDEMDLTGLSGAATIEDTPVNGEITKGITSNWAYDHENDPDAHGNDLYPWVIFLSVYHSPVSRVNWNTTEINIAWINNGSLNSSGAQNAEIAWDVVLAAGTWTIELIYQQNIDRGIYSVQFDSTEKGTIDSYGPGENNVKGSITGIVVPLTKKIELKLKIATKNTSSSNYLAKLNSVSLRRTA